MQYAEAAEQRQNTEYRKVIREREEIDRMEKEKGFCKFYIVIVVLKE